MAPVLQSERTEDTELPAETEQTDVHLRIARHIKVSGPCPSKWCTVCGYKIRPEDNRVDCGGNNKTCQNSCHLSCLHYSRNKIYNCADTYNLREIAGFPAPVEYLPLDQPPPQADQDQDQAQGQSDTEEEEENLQDLTNEDLIALAKDRQREIKNLRKELAKKTALLSHFNTEDLATKRDAVVSVLEFINNIQAIKTSTDALEVKSTATSARADLIDDDWLEKINSPSTGGVEAKDWWNSGKPKHLKSNPTGNRVHYIRPQQHNPALSQHSSQPQRSVPQQQRSKHPQQQPQQQRQQQQQQQQQHSSSRRPQSRSHSSTQLLHRPSQQQQQPQQHNSSQRPQARPQGPHRGSRNTGTHTNRQVLFCQYCKIKGHSENDCRKKQHCNFCKRNGHLEQDCRTKLSEERQERLMRTLSAEQAQNNALLFQSIQRQLLHPYQTPGHLTHSVWAGHNARC